MTSLGKPVTQRQLRVGEMIKQALGMLFIRDEAKLPNLSTKEITVTEGEITQDSNARVIRDGAIVFNGKIGSIFREKNQTKQVSAGLECGITLKDFVDFQKKDIIEVYNATVTERTI